MVKLKSRNAILLGFALIVIGFIAPALGFSLGIINTIFFLSPSATGISGISAIDAGVGFLGLGILYFEYRR